MYYNLRKFKSLDGPTKAQDVKDTSTEDELNARIEHLENRQRKIMFVGCIVVGALILTLIFNGISEHGTEEARWGVEEVQR